MKAKELLFFTKNKQELVPAGDPRARFFAFTEGQEIPPEHELKVVPAVKNKPVEAPPVRKSETYSRD
jgi:hypothetical protein